MENPEPTELEQELAQTRRQQDEEEMRGVQGPPDDESGEKEDEGEGDV